ncbi:MAG: type II toxin-antitoxin system VapB family antitoxin [Leptospiraceae bacterium]|nr:type II toxin-antitoxin system VapB family antitoxin [Leptospiraceae bacterium]
MKTTIDIPEKILSEVLLYSKMKSKKDAIITAMEEYVQKKKMEKFASKLGTLENLISNSELQKLRRKA